MFKGISLWFTEYRIIQYSVFLSLSRVPEIKLCLTSTKNIKKFKSVFPSVAQRRMNFALLWVEKSTSTNMSPFHISHQQSRMTLHFFACMCLQLMRMGFWQQKREELGACSGGWRTGLGVQCWSLSFMTWVFEAKGPGYLWTAPTKQGSVSGA